MADITALDGTVLLINDDSVVLVAGPFPGDATTRSYVSGPVPAAIATNEDAAALVARLHPQVPFARLTRPNGTAVWIKGGAVSMIRRPIAGETPPNEKVGAVIFLGALHQAVAEDVRAAQVAINQHGGRL